MIENNPIRHESFNRTAYANRRTRVASWLKEHGGGIAILPASPEVIRNRDNHYDYRADSYFYYLTGFTEPDGWLVITDTGRTIFFCCPKDPEVEVWTGIRLGTEAAPEVLGVDAAYSIDELDERLPRLLSNQPAVWYPFAVHDGLELIINEWMQEVRSRSRKGVSCPHTMHDLTYLLDEMRLIKDEYEIELMRHSAQIAAKAHKRVMQRCAQMVQAGKDVREYHLKAELMHEYLRQGAQDVSFSPIIAAGANACILHYKAGSTPVRAGDMVLVDSGCEYNYYASDITRTFPANGKFTEPQRDLYQIVLEAQNAARAEIYPNAIFSAQHMAALTVLSQGLLDLNILDRNYYGSAEDVIAEKAYARFYMHNTSHWLGLDVHDSGSYVRLKVEPTVVKDEVTGAERLQRPCTILRAGMMMTLEPGLYIPEASDVPVQFHNIGIRIEDDVLVTEKGCDLLTRDVPVEIDEIEQLMA